MRPSGGAFAVLLGNGDGTFLAPVKYLSGKGATADMLVEEVHFRRDWMSARDLGWKALAVNLSDCAAMGAEPRFALVCIGLAAGTDPGYVVEFYAGMQELTNRLFKKVQDELIPLVEQMGKERGCEIVFALQKRGAAWFTPAIDLTPELIKRYDASKAAPGK